MGKQWKQWQFYFNSKITVEGDCSHAIKRRFLLGRKVTTNLDSILKSRDITLPTKVLLVKAMVFWVVMYGCESWTVKKAECQRIDAFELCVVLEKTLESHLDCKEIQLVHSERDQFSVFIGRTYAKPETPILWPLHGKSWLIGKDPDAGKDWGQEKKGTTENEMAGRHQRLNGHEFEWNSRSWWWTGRPGLLWFMGSKRVRHDWALDWTDRTIKPSPLCTIPEYNIVSCLHLHFKELYVHPYKNYIER